MTDTLLRRVRRAWWLSKADKKRIRSALKLQAHLEALAVAGSRVTVTGPDGEVHSIAQVIERETTKQEAAA